MNNLTKLFVLIIASLFLVQAQGVCAQSEYGLTAKSYEGYFRGVGDVKIFCKGYRVENSKAIMVIVHGFGEHIGKYDGMIKHFKQMGLSTYALDHRGHGLSDGPRWNPESFDYYIDDLKTYVDAIKKWEPEKKIFMLGQQPRG